jgi:hypothetical protein
VVAVANEKHVVVVAILPQFKIHWIEGKLKPASNAIHGFAQQWR